MVIDEWDDALLFVDGVVEISFENGEILMFVGGTCGTEQELVLLDC